MFGFLKSDPTKKLQKEYEKLSEEAMRFQQNGNIEKYSELSQKAEEIAKEIDRLKEEAALK